MSDCNNVLAIARAAYRSQYGFQQDFARYPGEALPHAGRMGSTGTPITLPPPTPSTNLTVPPANHCYAAANVDHRPMGSSAMTIGA